MQDENERKGLLRLLSKLDIRLSNPYKVGRHFEYKIWIIHKFSRKRVYILDNQDELTLADVIEIIRNIVDVPDSFEEYCDTVVGADEDDEIDRYDYEDYRKRADIIFDVWKEKDGAKITDNLGQLNIGDEPALSFSYSLLGEEFMVVALMHNNVGYVFEYGTLKQNFDKDFDTMMDFFGTLRFT